MTAIIHDLNEQDFLSLNIGKNNCEIINTNVASAPCIGCFGCWFKTPGICKINDGIKNIGALLWNCEEIILISQNTYGGYSESVKKVLDRSISGSLPFFTYRSRKMRHTERYKVNRKYLTVFLYGNFSELEKNTAKLILEANRSNMGFKTAKLYTVNYFTEIEALLK